MIVPASVERDGASLAVFPDPINVVPSDTVRWSHIGGDSLWIHLGEVPGFDGVPRRAVNTVEVVIPTAIAVGEYKYSVTLWIDGSAVFADPRLIVRETREN